MNEDLVMRLRELASIPEHCENVSDCAKCLKEEICLSFTNKRIIEVATQAADAIEEMQKCLDGVSADNDSLCEKIAELSKILEAVQDAHNEGYDVGYWAGRRDYQPKWIPVTGKLPEREKICIVNRYSDRLGESYITTALHLSYGDWSLPGVTHWMPLPEPPKEDT